MKPTNSLLITVIVADIYLIEKLESQFVHCQVIMLGLLPSFYDYGTSNLTLKTRFFDNYNKVNRETTIVKILVNWSKKILIYKRYIVS